MNGCKTMEQVKVVKNDKKETLIQFGFSFKKSSVHTKRTMMLNELRMIFDRVDIIDSDSSQYKNAIIDENCTRKRSGATRKYTSLYLRDLYMLDPDNALFRALGSSQQIIYPSSLKICSKY